MPAFGNQAVRSDVEETKKRDIVVYVGFLAMNLDTTACIEDLTGWPSVGETVSKILTFIDKNGGVTIQPLIATFRRSQPNDNVTTWSVVEFKGMPYSIFLL